MGFYTVLLVIHTIVVIFLILMVLIQRTDSDGMGGLGGGGGNQFMSGRSTANLMTRTTSVLATAFMISSLVLAVYAGRMSGGSIVDSVPAEEATTAPITKPAETENLSKDQATEADKPKAADKTDKASKPAKSEKSSKSAPSVPKPE
jgi:preprotein translocase subunit SecG